MNDLLQGDVPDPATWEPTKTARNPQTFTAADVPDESPLFQETP